MGALYDICIVGSNTPTAPPRCATVLHYVKKIRTDLTKSLCRVRVMDSYGETSPGATLDVTNTEDWNDSEHVAFYSDVVAGAVVYHVEEFHWEISIAIPIEDKRLIGKGSKEIVTEVWSAMQSLRPKFCAAGEELEVWRDSENILSGVMKPLQIHLCDFAIISDELRVKFPSETGERVPNGLMITH